MNLRIVGAVHYHPGMGCPAKKRSAGLSKATVDERIEYHALGLLAASDQPLGSPALASYLRGQDIQVAEATAGRVLRELDRRGFTRALSKRGRELTDAGRERLAELTRLERLSDHSSEMLEAVDIRDLDALLDLLYARRAIEPEAARLAAERASPEERQRIGGLSDVQVRKAAVGESPNEVALDFHRLVFEASHNRMLTAIGRILLDSTNDPMASLLDRLADRKSEYPHLAHDHDMIQEAIRIGDAATAERAMRAHIDSLVSAVESSRRLMDSQRPQSSTVASGRAAPLPSREEAISGFRKSLRSLRGQESATSEAGLR